MIREKIIKGYIAGKDVLDIGGVGQTKDYNLWQEIRPYAKSLTGIDIESSQDKDIVVGNMESYSFNKKFDVVVAGDVLEHVDNQGLFLDNIRRHLKSDGVLILTTPNAKWPTVFMPTNITHTLWHDRATIKNILLKHGFEVASFRYYYGNKRYYNIFARLLVLRQAMLVICKIKEK